MEKILKNSAQPAKRHCRSINRIIWKEGESSLQFDFEGENLLQSIEVQGNLDSTGEKILQEICHQLKAVFYDSHTGRIG